MVSLILKRLCYYGLVKYYSYHHQIGYTRCTNRTTSSNAMLYVYGLIFSSFLYVNFMYWFSTFEAKWCSFICDVQIYKVHMQIDHEYNKCVWLQVNFGAHKYITVFGSFSSVSWRTISFASVKCSLHTQINYILSQIRIVRRHQTIAYSIYCACMSGIW